MKFIFACLLGLYVVATAESRQLTALDLRGGSRGGTVTRVVKLMQNLEEKLEKEAEAEKDLYDKFVCWGTSTKETKTDAIAVANKRIAHLQGYIAEIESGKLDFTNEKQQLDSELAKVTAEINNLTARREQDFLKHTNDLRELEEAENGLEDARDILRNATDGVSLIALRGSTAQARAVRFKGRAAGRFERMRKLRQVLKVVDQYLKKDDAAFVRQVIAGQQSPENVDTTQDLESKSGGVITLVGDLRAQTQQDIEQEIADENNRVKTFNQTLKILLERKSSVESSLDEMAEETAKREKAKTESQDEIDSLNDQNKDDQDLINEITAALTQKQTEYDERSTYRQGELQAIGQAIELLTSDDARDLFHKAISFLQTSETESMFTAASRHASNTLLSAGKAASDSRLMIMAANLAAARRANPVFNASNDANITNPTFDLVLAEIDKMKQTIREEEASDFNIKETCEEQLDQNTATKVLKEREIDAADNKIAFKEGQIQDYTRQIDKTLQEIANVESELEDMKELRDKTKEEFESAKKDDEDCVVLIERATKVITDFYAEQESAAAQESAVLMQQPVSDNLRKVGAKDTWSEAYNGAGAQSDGVVETMKVVSDDVKKEIAVAVKEEAESVAEYESMKAKLEKEKESLEETKVKLKMDKGDAEQEKEQTMTERKDDSTSLKGVLKTMDDAKPGCDFYLNNFAARQKNRLTEIKGLDKAKAILKGAVFEDKNRELKAGDS